MSQIFICVNVLLWFSRLKCFWMKKQTLKRPEFAVFQKCWQRLKRDSLLKLQIGKGRTLFTVLTVWTTTIPVCNEVHLVYFSFSSFLFRKCIDTTSVYMLGYNNFILWVVRMTHPDLSLPLFVSGKDDKVYSCF